MGPGIEPGDSAAELLDLELSTPEIGGVDVGDLELAARRWLEAFCDLHHLVVVEVEPGHGVRRARLDRLFLQPDRAAVGGELDDAVALGIAYPVGEHRCPGRAVGSALEVLGQSVAVEDVVAERQGHPVSADEAPADDEGLGQALGFGLDGVFDPEPEMPAVAEQPLEGFLILRSRDDQNLRDPREHQGG